MRHLARIALVAAVLVVVPSAPAHARDDGPQAVARWSMVPQAKDANHDGVIDGDGGVPARGALSRAPSPSFVGAGNHRAQPNERLIGGSLSWYLHGAGYPVRLDACASRGEQYRWTVVREGADPVTTPWHRLGRHSCADTVVLPEGRHDLRLEVATGSRRARTSTPADIRNIIVVSLGDSYAAGEGNPRNVMSWLRRGGAITPYWDEDACHRSARSGPALAALELERRSPATSVTFVDVSCSGATVDAGILGPQRPAGQSASQVEQATAILGSRSADLVLLSIGGNDIGFSSILQTCAFTADCPIAAPPAVGPLAGAATVNAGIQAQTTALAADLDRIAACVGGTGCRLADGRASPGLALATGGTVRPTLYPDVTRAADGGPCSYLTIPTADFAWARSTVLSPTPTPTYPYPRTNGTAVVLDTRGGSLNGQLAATTRLPGWAPILGTWSVSGDSPGGHGVCAGDQAWVFGFTGLTGLPSASFHPNPAGQQAISAAIVQAALAVVTAVAR